MRFLIFLLTFIALTFSSCTQLVEDLYGPLPETPVEEKEAYFYVDNCKDIKINIVFDKVTRDKGGIAVDNYITVKIIDANNDERWIEGGDIKINDYELVRQFSYEPYYITYYMEINPDSIYTLHVTLSDGKVYSETLPFPKQEISNLVASEMLNPSDKVTITWDNALYDGAVNIHANVTYDNSVLKKAIYELETQNSYSFEENYFLTGVFQNDSLLIDEINIVVTGSWRNTNPLKFTNSVEVYHKLRKTIWR